MLKYQPSINLNLDETIVKEINKIQHRKDKNLTKEEITLVQRTIEEKYKGEKLYFKVNGLQRKFVQKYENIFGRKISIVNYDQRGHTSFYFAEY